jgi:hypothetical protein
MQNTRALHFDVHVFVFEPLRLWVVPHWVCQKQRPLLEALSRVHPAQLLHANFQRACCVQCKRAYHPALFHRKCSFLPLSVASASRANASSRNHMQLWPHQTSTRLQTDLHPRTIACQSHPSLCTLAGQGAHVYLTTPRISIPLSLTLKSDCQISCKQISALG